MAGQGQGRCWRWRVAAAALQLLLTRRQRQRAAKSGGWQSGGEGGGLHEAGGRVRVIGKLKVGRASLGEERQGSRVWQILSMLRRLQKNEGYESAWTLCSGQRRARWALCITASLGGLPHV